MQKPIIVFDLDGTLVDTAPDLLDSLNHCLEAGGVPAADAAKLRSFVGMGGRVMIERAFAAHGTPLEQTRLDELMQLFLDHYTANMPGKSLPFPGVIDALDRFRDAGFLIAICTNKFEGLSAALMRGLKLDDRFVANCGQDTFAHRKPDPRHLTLTIERAGGDPRLAVMVGDSRTDIDTAKAAGIPVIAVDFGYTDQHVRMFEPSRIISHFDELTVEMARSLIDAANR